VAFYPLVTLLELDEGFRRVVRVGTVDLLVIHDGGQTHVIGRACPHAGAPLERASVSEGCLTCPRHGARFDLQTGRALNAGCGPLRRYTPAYEGRQLGVDL